MTGVENFAELILVLAGTLFAGMLLVYELGWRLGAAKLARSPERTVQGIGAAMASVFSLLGLTLAFTFNGAGERFEARRHLVTEEANAIGTAYLRLDALPKDVQPELRDLFRRYTELRAATYVSAKDIPAAKLQLADCAALQGEIWQKATAACQRPETQPTAAIILLPALNEMIDITTTREMANRNHPPMAVFITLGLLALASTFLMGYDTALTRIRGWFYVLAFAGTMVLSVYVTAELEYPHLGLIRVNDANQILVELRQSMN